MAALSDRLESIFSLEKAVPKLQPEKLDLFGRGVDDPLQGLEIALDRLSVLKEAGEVDGQVIAHLSELSLIILEELDLHDHQISHSKFEFGHDKSPELFEIAKKYCTLHAATCCLHVWLYNRTVLGDFLAQGEWLVLSLHRLLRTLRPLPYTISGRYVESVAQELLKLHKEAKLFSIVPIQLAQSQIPKDKSYANSEFQLHN
jgi:hypothetical protein